MNSKEEQFKKLISENEERIKRICRYYAPDKDEQKDIYQEILINIWKSLESFRGDASISTWIYRIAVNTSLSFMGKSFKRMKLHVNSDTQNLSSLLDESNYEDKLREETQFNQIQLELNQLSVIDKALISLQLEGLSMKEISEIIGITEPNVKVKIHRIKEQLREKMKGVDYE
ncbi:MAG TPA: hypothetical protein DCQ26_07500 [Marinilabiliales bacterium]|jgi:RNA polymerase sigma-70 factor (ECF subfamily)|nr:MAG: hypothetical protein A2W95_06515 [Bacteroidetes bacterium GWA2_40_14]OFX64183.1 MAG: hypothetical protein A2W84_02790 [Bacteroidetes bacterium GWC2_40_13]OFX71878.1 MAG: hypothetical protein A2W96_06505 [Bacteroidetes bacterium GWD2_40_43]OFX94675.1 MAG: hypothetical protein A2W97_18310 [Bacteroidetes bacterium GWE2_40_63]OFY24796.1 MAG: hypothetical protein A2W88_17005 [Bacteroidetes bacterium GWF2_40_13]OFZ24441.1 MAG: hypothetical protein A2437_18445 [Bacteroidetes bacterium RIFOXYC